MSSSEKRHELALVKRRHEELERQYQVSIRLKEQENRPKFKKSQLELKHLAESHKKQLIEMEMKAFELENSSSEVSENAVESHSTGVNQPISKVATDRTNDWVDSVSSQAPPDGAVAPCLLAFTPVTLSSEPTTSAILAHAIHTSNSHHHEHTALSDPGIYSYVIGLCLNLAVQAFCHCKLLFHLFHYQLTICTLVHTCYQHRLRFLYRP